MYSNALLVYSAPVFCFQPLLQRGIGKYTSIRSCKIIRWDDSSHENFQYFLVYLDYLVPFSFRLCTYPKQSIPIFWLWFGFFWCFLAPVLLWPCESTCVWILPELCGTCCCLTSTGWNIIAVHTANLWTVAVEVRGFSALVRLDYYNPRLIHGQWLKN